ncbi:virion core protein, T7 gp14 family [Variovorax boronicumulans]|uniref:virion core protein, T7 gp14 family n=1 Tax=Variovorax boronicumulans TaxID=436515 RepID=UPI003396FB9D
MCEPTTITLIASAAVSAVGAVAANNANNDAIMAQADANNRNTAEGYRVAQENDRAAAAQAFEKQTDRSRQAARQLSMARVLAAQGGGSLEANAINISAAAAEDFSRIDTGLTNTIASNRQQMGALQTQNADALASASVQVKASNSKLTGDLAGIAVSTGTKYFSNEKAQWMAEHHVPEMLRKRQAFQWATGTKGMGD